MSAKISVHSVGARCFLALEADTVERNQIKILMSRMENMDISYEIPIHDRYWRVITAYIMNPPQKSQKKRYSIIIIANASPLPAAAQDAVSVKLPVYFWNKLLGWRLLMAAAASEASLSPYAAPLPIWHANSQPSMMQAFLKSEQVRLRFIVLVRLRLIEIYCGCCLSTANKSQANKWLLPGQCHMALDRIVSAQPFGWISLANRAVWSRPPRRTVSSRYMSFDDFKINFFEN